MFGALLLWYLIVIYINWVILVDTVNILVHYTFVALR